MTPNQLDSLIDRTKYQLRRIDPVPYALILDLTTALEAYARLLAERVSGDGDERMSDG